MERSYTWPKWLFKMKALLTLILRYVHACKREYFYFNFISRGIFSLCPYGYVIVTLKRPSKDIPGSMISRANESWFKCQTKNSNWRFGLIFVAHVNRHELNFFPGNLFYRPMVLILFHFFYAGLFLKSWKRLPFLGHLEYL